MQETQTTFQLIGKVNLIDKRCISPDMKDIKKNEIIIGGVFGLEDPFNSACSLPTFLEGKNICLANARSGIRLMVERLHPQRVWMPSYLCSSMLEGVDIPGVELRYFEIDHDLACSSRHWIDEVGRDDIVILIDYFGFSCDNDLVAAVKERGAWVMEDACQALLSNHQNSKADFILYSPRKFIGVPDGGILVVRNDKHIKDIRLQSAPGSWWLKALFANIQRREFDHHGGERKWFDLFQTAEREAPIGPYRMSDLTQYILWHALDYAAIGQRRIANYCILLERLQHLAIFPHLCPGVVPLGFPVRLKDRDYVLHQLFSHNIYPPVHWPIAGIVPEHFVNSHALASQIMTLPCDQRYDKQDMLRMSSLLESELPP